MMTVVDDDDVSRRGTISKPRNERLRGLRAKPVEIPQHPAPSNHPVACPFRAEQHRYTAIPPVRPEGPTWRVTGHLLDAGRRLRQRCSHSAWRFEHQRPGVRMERDSMTFLKRSPHDWRSVVGQ